MFGCLELRSYKKKLDEERSLCIGNSFLNDGPDHWLRRILDKGENYNNSYDHGDGKMIIATIK